LIRDGSCLSLSLSAARRNGGTRLGPCRDWLASRSRDARFGGSVVRAPSPVGCRRNCFSGQLLLYLGAIPSKRSNDDANQLPRARPSNISLIHHV
jgi:hypothetical protein